jgi:DNA-binding transcriptional ArsR family regulator
VTRRALLEKLRHGPLPVGELAHHLPVARPAVSQNLRILKEAQLVQDEAIGTRRYYKLDPRLTFCAMTLRIDKRGTLIFRAHHPNRQRPPAGDPGSLVQTGMANNA